MTVYVVIDGEYYDRRIVGTFLDKDKAEYFRKFYTSENGEIETCDTMDDDYTIDVETITYYEIEMDNMGKVLKCSPMTFEYIPGKEDFKELFNYSNIWFKGFHGRIIADSEEQAIKIMHDKRTQWLAESFGI